MDEVITYVLKWAAAISLSMVIAFMIVDFVRAIRWYFWSAGNEED